MKKPMTNKEYRRIKGQICPSCRSRDNLHGGFIDIDGNEAHQQVVCEDCLARWVDVYKLTGYCVLQQE